MRDRLPQEHDVFAAALPDLRAHFEQAAQNSADYTFIFGSIADDMRRAEQHVAENGVVASGQHIERARQTLISISEATDYHVLGGDLEAAVNIAVAHSKRMAGPAVK